MGFEPTVAGFTVLGFDQLSYTYLESILGDSNSYTMVGSHVC